MSRPDCVSCGERTSNGVVSDGEIFCYDCWGPEDGPSEDDHYDELDGGSGRVAVRDRHGCVVVTDPHMALWISESAQ